MHYGNAPETITGVKVIGAPVGFRKHNEALISPPGGRAPGWKISKGDPVNGEPVNVPAGFTSVAVGERFVTSTSRGPAIVLERVVRSGGRLGLSTVMTVHESGLRLLRSGGNGRQLLGAGSEPNGVGRIRQAWPADWRQPDNGRHLPAGARPSQSASPACVGPVRQRAVSLV